VTEDLARELELLREFGFTHLDIPRGEHPHSASGGQPPSAVRSDDAAFASEGSAGSQNDLLAEMRAVVTACEKCRLAKTRTQVVYGVGNPNADLMFIGEAPGRDEDIQGEPFVGRAGQPLTEIIKAMKLTRDDVYIANVIKCRPPENRNPEPDELDACRPYIRRQVELIEPKVIVTLGRFALQSLTEKAYGITSVRGQWLEYNGVKVMPTYHPAYLLRNPAAKKEVWADMKKVMAELGLN